MNKGNPKALLPIGVFLVVYLGLGILFEYILGKEMGFYNIPIIAIFLLAIMVALLQNRALPFDKKMELMAKGMADKNVIIMVMIFIIAGIFSAIVGRTGAQSVANFLLSIVPLQLALPTIFFIACFVSTAMGTSVGTITILVPIAAEIAATAGISVPLCIGTVMGGAMFGDNLSFISDTTIAACNGQGCEMKDKFKQNFRIALPAGIATMIAVFLMGGMQEGVLQLGEYSLLQILPYILVLIGGLIGINVFLVLLIGIVSGSIIMLATGTTEGVYGLLGCMGEGISGMYETATVAILVAAMCGLIREYGGFDSLLYCIKKIFKGNKGGQLGMGVLVGIMDIATANNTVAIVMANPIAKEMSADFGITNKKAASLLDTFSCIFQGIIPYGAQMLVAIAQAGIIGYSVSAFEIIPCLIYPFLLLISSLIFIFFIPERGQMQE